MNGIVAHFRGSRRRKKTHQMIIYLDGVDTKDKAQKLMGKKVTWTSNGKEPTKITGTITNTHGNKGAVRVQFEKGLPGQSLGQEVAVA
jgi:large subunit ribosomal protein L35Ae